MDSSNLLRSEARIRRLWPTLLLIAAIACVWFLTLDARHLLRSDEGRYAEIAREMLVSGDWITIRYNDLKYFEKPPFQIWMTALAFKTFGIGEWQARLWVACCGAAGLLITMEAARRWFGTRIGVLTGLALLAAPAWNLASHFNSLDMGVSGALAFVLASVLIAQHPEAGEPSRRNWMLTAWVAMAIAFLTKGLIGIVLPGLVLVVYCALARDWTLWRRLHLLLGACAFLLIVAPWFVLVSSRNPEFLQFFFVHEHLERFFSKIHHRTGPWWYFIPIVVGGFLPWLFLGARVVRVVRGGPRRPALRPQLLLAVWTAAIFVFFSLSKSKLPGYIVPVFPALAILVALALDGLESRAWKRGLAGAGVFFVLALLAAPLLDRFGSAMVPASLFNAYAPWLAATSGLAIVGLVVAWRLEAKHRMASVVAYSLTVFVAATLLFRGHEVFGRASSGVDLVPAIRAVAGPSVPIYSVRLLDHTLPFYLGRTMIMVEAPDELAFGVAREPAKWLPTIAAFEARWRSGVPAVAVMAHDTYDRLRADELMMIPVASDARRVVVANFEGPHR